MNKPHITFPDLELWLTTWLRPQLPDCFVSNRLVAHDDRFSVIVVDDSGPDGWVTAQRRVSVTCRGGMPAATSALATYVASLMRTAADADGPVAAVGQIFGPYRTGQDDAGAELYMSVELTLVGSPAPEEPTYV